MTRKVLVIGCGSIFRRHQKAIANNSSFKLIAVCDIQKEIVSAISKQLGVKGFTDYKQAVLQADADFCVIATPNSLHYEQSLFCLQNGCDILVEKPVDFTRKRVNDILNVARQERHNAYCVLQVRLNPTINVVRQCINGGLLGDIRAVNLVQRWQRPYEYFSGWRAEPEIGGGTLYEVGIHYLDILQSLFGMPNIHSSKIYKIKHKETSIEDTIYSLMDFGKFGGTCEITIAAEPHNLECSLQILGSNGYLKLGGKAMNIIESYNFLSNGCKIKFENILENSTICNTPNSYGSYQGSCPNHDGVYENLSLFKMEEALNSINLIEEIYNKAGVKYGK